MLRLLRGFGGRASASADHFFPNLPGGSFSRAMYESPFAFNVASSPLAQLRAACGAGMPGGKAAASEYGGFAATSFAMSEAVDTNRRQVAPRNRV